MLKTCKTFEQLNIPALLDIYRESIKKQMEMEGISCFQAEDAFLDYLRNDFFIRAGCIYAVWIKESVWVSALRIEPYADGYLLSGLETKPDHRGNGYAAELIQETLLQTSDSAVYAHIHKRNTPSLSVHKKCGFVILEDFARLLDGTVSTQYFTLIKK